MVRLDETVQIENNKLVKTRSSRLKDSMKPPRKMKPIAQRSAIPRPFRRSFGTNRREELTSLDPIEIAKKVRHDSVKIIIGKNGVTSHVAEELKRRVNIHHAVKVAILTNSPIDPDKLSLKNALEGLASESGTKLWRFSGRVGVFVKEKGSR